MVWSSEIWVVVRSIVVVGVVGTFIAIMFVLPVWNVCCLYCLIQGCAKVILCRQYQLKVDKIVFYEQKGDGGYQNRIKVEPNSCAKVLA